MNVDKLKEDAEFCKSHNFTSMASIAPQDVLDLIAAYEGSQFAAASHLRTVEQQAKIIAGNAEKVLIAEALAVFDLMLVGCTVPNFADYQNGDGEEIGARMDALHAALKAGQAAPIQSGDEIPVSMSTYGTKEACEAEHARRAMLAAAPTPPAAQPQAGGRELTDAEIDAMAVESGANTMVSCMTHPKGPRTAFQFNDEDGSLYRFARSLTAHITGTKGATE